MLPRRHGAALANGPTRWCDQHELATARDQILVLLVVPSPSIVVLLRSLSSCASPALGLSSTQMLRDYRPPARTMTRRSIADAPLLRVSRAVSACSRCTLPLPVWPHTLTERQAAQPKSR